MDPSDQCSPEEYYHKLDRLELTAIEQVRKVFTNRWIEVTGEEWTDDDKQRANLRKILGKRVLYNASSLQKKALRNKCLPEWDIQVLFLILNNFGQNDNNKKKTDAVYALKKLRNELAHHKSRKIPRPEYDKKLSDLKKTMKSLGMEKSQIKKLVDNVEVSSSLQATEAVTNKYQQADEFQNKGDFDKAVGVLSEAVSMPSLLPVDRGVAYEKRAECYLNSVEQIVSDRDKCDLALQDAMRALQFNDCSWKAHYLTAKGFHLKNNLAKALHHYERALTISPTQKQVKSDYDSCRDSASWQRRKDHLDPNCLPVSVYEVLTRVEKEKGLKIDKLGFFNITGRADLMIWKGQEHVFVGHRFYNGWEVPQSFSNAVQCYARAAARKNTAGMYHLAKCYHEGNGVQKDIQESIRRFRELAEMDPGTEGPKTALRCNLHVAEAERVVGMLYEEGVGVERDYGEAAKWYLKGMDHGNDQAAYGLGRFYLRGVGVSKDDKMALYCIRQAVNLIYLDDKDTASALAGVYLYFHWEPERAEEMYRLGRHLESLPVAGTCEEDIKKDIRQVKATRKEREPEMEEFEKMHALTTKGLTFQERVDRKLGMLYPLARKAQKVFEDGFNFEVNSWKDTSRNLSKDTISAIQARARDGSPIAKRIITTVTSCEKINAMLQTDKGLTFNQEREVLDLLYLCVTSERSFLDVRDQAQLRSIVVKWFHEKCETPGEDDMKFRLCYVIYNLEGSVFSPEEMYGVHLLKEGIRRYPDNEHYYHLLTEILGCKGIYEEAQSVAEQGLEKFFCHDDLLFSRALNMERGPQLSSKLKECMIAYSLFRLSAPGDHPKKPEALYRVAYLQLYLYGKSGVPVQSFEELAESELTKRLLLIPHARETVEYFFEEGQQAEREQLPCLLPYPESDAKMCVDYFLKQNNITKTAIPCENLEESVLERKKYLRDPLRKALVVEHGQNLFPMFESFENPITKRSKLRQQMVRKMSGVRRITLEEMSSPEDHIFENRRIDLTILQEPKTKPEWIQVIAEDDNGDVTRLFIYNVEKTPENLDNFGAGCRIGIVNPYLRVGIPRFTSGLRNDDPRCIVYLGKVENMCRFCGEENATYKCGKCKRPYCSKECLTLDSEMFEHELICKLKW